MYRDNLFPDLIHSLPCVAWHALSSCLQVQVIKDMCLEYRYMFIIVSEYAICRMRESYSYVESSFCTLYKGTLQNTLISKSIEPLIIAYLPLQGRI